MATINIGQTGDLDHKKQWFSTLYSWRKTHKTQLGDPCSTKTPP